MQVWEGWRGQPSWPQCQSTMLERELCTSSSSPPGVGKEGYSLNWCSPPLLIKYILLAGIGALGIRQCFLEDCLESKNSLKFQNFIWREKLLQWLIELFVEIGSAELLRSFELPFLPFPFSTPELSLPFSAPSAPRLRLLPPCHLMFFSRAERGDTSWCTADVGR